MADAALLTRELARRLSGGVEVLLLWHPDTNSVELVVDDPAAQVGCRVAVAPEHAIDAFYHPYAYAGGAPCTAKTRRRSRMASAERVHEAVRQLAAERQALHARGAGRDELESNRLELVPRQRELALAVVARCLGRPERDAA